VEILKYDNDINDPIIGDYNDNTDGAIWLFRQDQLQEIYNPSWYVCINDLALWYEKLERPIESTFGSMEQLWLALLYHEKYGKRWDGDNWV
jgi:hypothetical protein